jgi:putative ABC transport system permease protein
LRQKVRSILTMVAIVLAVALVILGHSGVNGAMETMMSGLFEQTGHVRIRNAGYAKQERLDPLGYTIKGWRDKRAKLQAIEGVTAVAPRTQFGMMVQYTDESTIVEVLDEVDESKLSDDEIFGRKVTEMTVGRAVLPSVERTIQSLERWLVQGDYFSGDDAAEVMIGAELASRLGVKAGATLQLISYRDGISDATVLLVGIFDSGNVIMNKMVYATHPVAESLLNLNDQVTELIIFGTSSAQADALLSQIDDAGLALGMEIQPWHQIGMFRTIIPINNYFAGLLAFILIVVAAAGLLNTMMMSVLERQREIGVIMALGLKRRSVVKIIAMEAGIFAIAGSVLGSILGGLVTLYFGSHGLTLTSEQTKQMPFAIQGDLHAVLTVEAFVYGIAVGLIVSMLASFGPALKASGLSPVEAMRR